MPHAGFRGRRWAVAIIAAVALIAAGIAWAVVDRAPRDGATQLRITVRSDAAGDVVRRRTISCPEGPASTCQRLAHLDPADFRPEPRPAACTEIYGGPATAVVEGSLRGRALRAEFDRRDGCAIARWSRFDWLIGDPPRLSPF